MVGAEADLGQGLLYKGHKIVPYCPRCGTSLSSHEVAQGYKDVKEPSIYVKFKVKVSLRLPDGMDDDSVDIAVERSSR